MSDAKCPTCGALCNVVEETIYPEPHSILIPIQPDLTKLAEVYEKFKHLDELLSDKGWLSNSDFKYHIMANLWQAVKKIFEEKI